MKYSNKHLQNRALSAEEIELVEWFKEDFYWYNELKALQSLQERDLELVQRMGDLDGTIREQITDAENKIADYSRKITNRRRYKRELFAALDTDVKTIMEMRYLSYCTWEDIANNLECSYQSVLRKHNKGIVLLNIILGGKEKRNDRQTFYDTISTENEKEQSKDSD